MTMDENEAYTPKNVARFVLEHMKASTAYELGKLFLPSVPILPSDERKELDELVQAFEDQAKRSE